MKICFLTPEFPHHKTGSSGGIGTSIFNLAKGIIQLGHNVVIVVYGQENDDYFQENGIDFHLVKNIKIKGLSAFFTQKKIQRLINNLVSEEKIDIVEVPDWTGFSAFLNINCPLIVKLNGSDTYFCHLDNRPVKFKNKLQEKLALKRSNGIIAVSDYTGKLTQKLFNLKSTYTVIPNAIDTNVFDNQSLSNNSETILCFGTLIRKKGLMELPLIFNEVFKKKPNSKLILIGKDASDILTKNPSTWQLMQPLFNENARKNVQYLGEIPYSEIKKQIQDATICVFPTFAEALPVSWLEAMAMKKPIVASNIGWAIEIIDDGKNGFLVNPTSHVLFADKICHLLSDFDLQIRFGLEARKKIIDNFAINIVANKNIEFYEKFI